MTTTAKTEDETPTDHANGLTYAEHAPHPALDPYVECYWSFRPRGAAAKGLIRPSATLVLPDGCTDILFSFGEPPKRTDGTATAHPSEPCVVGTMTRAVRVRRSGPVDVLGIRFRPGGASPWLPDRADELVDTTAPLAAWWGTAATHAHDRIGGLDNIEGRIPLLDTLLLSRFEPGRHRGDPRVLRATALLARSGGTEAVGDVADQVGLGVRQLERAFLRAVGVSPKTLGRVIRFRRAAELLHDRRHTLSDVAFACGFADQAHFTRDFRCLAGVTPGAFRAASAASASGAGSGDDRE